MNQVVTAEGRKWTEESSMEAKQRGANLINLHIYKFNSKLEGFT